MKQLSDFLVGFRYTVKTKKNFKLWINKSVFKETFSSEDLSIIAHETVLLKIDILTNQIKALCIL